MPRRPLPRNNAELSRLESEILSVIDYFQPLVSLLEDIPPEGLPQDAAGSIVREQIATLTKRPAPALAVLPDYLDLDPLAKELMEGIDKCLDDKAQSYVAEVFVRSGHDFSKLARFLRLLPGFPVDWLQTNKLMLSQAEELLREIYDRYEDRIIETESPDGTTRGEQDSDDPSRLTPGSKALAAAHQLQKEGKPVSIKAAAELARVDRSHLHKSYPEVVAAIKFIASPDRRPPRGSRDRETGKLEAWDDE